MAKDRDTDGGRVSRNAGRRSGEGQLLMDLQLSPYHLPGSGHLIISSTTALAVVRLRRADTTAVRDHSVDGTELRT